MHLSEVVAALDSWSPACWAGLPASHIISSRSRSLQYLFQTLLCLLEASPPLFSLTRPWVGALFRKEGLTACPQTPLVPARALVLSLLPGPLLPGASAHRLPSTPDPPQASLDGLPRPVCSRPALCSPRALSPRPSRALLLLPSACSRVSTCPVLSPAVSSQEPGGLSVASLSGLHSQ